MESRTWLVAVLAALSFTLGCGPRWPQDLEEPARDLVVGGEGLLRTYDNGLVLFVAPDPRTELVQLDMRQRVGSRDDPPGKAGLAHLVEHVMFGIPTAGPGSPRASAVLASALNANAGTTRDETDFTQTGTADDLESFFRVTAARLGVECSAIDDAWLAREKEVVRLEHAWRRETILPKIVDDLFAQVFPEGHPYRRTVLPDEAEFASITRDDVCAFIDRYYTAGQASVVITGNVDPQTVAALAKAHLAHLPNITVEPRVVVPPAEVAGRTIEVVAPTQRPATLLLYELPPRFTVEHTAASVAFAMAPVFVLLNDRVGRRGAKPSLVACIPVFLGGKASSLVGLLIETETPAELAAATQRALDSIDTGFGLSAGGSAFRGVYDRARQRTRIELLDAVAASERRGSTYADYLEEGEAPGFLGVALARVDGLSGDAVQRVGRTVFARERAMVVEVRPGADADAPRLDRVAFEAPDVVEDLFDDEALIDAASAHAPLPFTPREPDREHFQRIVHPSGLQMVLANSTEVPLLDVRVVVRGGLRDAGDGLPEIPMLAAGMYDSRDDELGRSVMTPFELAGAEYEATVRPRTTVHATRGLAIYLDHIIAGMAERVIEPAFVSGRFDRWLEARRAELATPQAQRDAKRRNTLRTALYGEGHPHAVQEPVVPKDLGGGSRFAIEGFRRKHVRAENTTVVVSGGIALDLARDYVEGHFASGKRIGVNARWLARSPYDDEIEPIPEPRPGKVRIFTEVDDARGQTQLTVMFPLAEVFGPDHAALAIAVEMLDVGLRRLREQLGLTYGVGAALDTELPQIIVRGAVDSSRAAEAMRAIEGVIAAVRTGEGFDARFVVARRTLVRRLLALQSDPRVHADELADAIAAGLPLEYFDRLPANVAATTAEQVRGRIDRLLAPERSVTLVQGPARAIEAVRKEFSGMRVEAVGG